MEDWKRFKAALAVGIIALGCQLVGASPANAGGPAGKSSCKPHGSAIGKSINSKTLAEFTSLLDNKGRSQAEIDKVLASEWCVVKVGVEPIKSAGVARLAERSDVEVGTSLYYNQRDTMYYAAMTWQWKNQNYKDDYSGACFDDQEIGGEDAWGVRVAGANVYNFDHGAFYQGRQELAGRKNHYGQSTVEHSAVANDHGTGWMAQDHAIKVGAPHFPGCTEDVDFNMDHGNGWQTVYPYGIPSQSCVRVQIYAKYVHTWDETEVNSIGVGADSFSIGWTNEGHDFQIEEPGVIGDICNY
ncbi:hypothetical protein [Krasilnikovia sp. MM14-A1004]|uniref:hypothetical protein n=1 Tax=Krasilnikovia sp. MM14-A1004 TaxID=3373541 RepID=UPI00399C6DA0